MNHINCNILRFLFQNIDDMVCLSGDDLSSNAATRNSTNASNYCSIESKGNIESRKVYRYCPAPRQFAHG